jgi:hypothetical protein
MPPSSNDKAALFKRRPDEVRAIRWTGDNIEAVMDFMTPIKPQYMVGFSNADDLIGIPGGVVSKGDWIVRRPDALDLWHLTDERFGERYEPA